MKLCPTCHQCYEDRYTLCVYDRASLVPSRPGTRLIAQKYNLDRLLSNGGMDAIYTGTHFETHRPVAIKLLLPGSAADSEASKRLRREALALAHLNTRVDHEHVAKTYDYGLLPDGAAYIAMELIAGQTLREYMDDSGGQIPTASAIRIARQVADGLEAAHRCGVVHRNLEPSKIILARDYYGQPEAKVFDFGFAKLQRQTLIGAGNGGSTAAEPLGCTPRYMSPERRAGNQPDERSDIYSLGLILYEMLMGRLPFEAPAAAALGHTEEPLPPKESRVDVPEPLAELVTQALRKRPAARLSSAAEFARRLQMIEDSMAQPSPAAQDLELLAPAYPDQSLDVEGPSAADSNSPPMTVPVTDLQEDEREIEPAGTLFIEDSYVLPEECGDPANEKAACAEETVTEPPAQLPPSEPVVASLPAFDVGIGAPAEALPSTADKPVLRRHQLIYAISAMAVLVSAGGLWLTWQHVPSFRPASPTVLIQSSTPEASVPEQAASITTVGASLPPAETDGSSLIEAKNLPVVKTRELSLSHTEAISLPGTKQPSQEATREQKDAASVTGDSAAKPNTPDAAVPSEPATKQPPQLTTSPPAVKAKSPPDQKPGGGDPCTMSVSQSSLAIRSNGGSGAITVSLNGLGGPANITAGTADWSDIAVFPEPKTAKSGGSSKYSIISVGKWAGTFNVSFRTPCGSRVIPVMVK